MSEPIGEDFSKDHDQAGAGHEKQRPGKLFSEEQLGGLFEKRAEAIKITDPEERSRSMREIDGERENLREGLTAKEQDQLARVLAEEEENFEMEGCPLIMADMLSEERPIAVGRRLPKATVEADLQELDALKAQLADLQYQFLYRDPRFGVRFNRSDFNKRAAALLGGYSTKVGMDQLLALVQGLPARQARKAHEDELDFLDFHRPDMPLQRQFLFFSPLSPDSEREIHGEEISARRLLQEFDGTSLNGEILFRGEFDEDGTLIGFKTARADMSPDEIDDIIAQPVREGNPVENFLNDPGGEGVLIPWDEKYPILPELDESGVTSLDNPNPTASSVVLNHIGQILADDRAQWEEERLRDSNVPDFRVWIGEKRWEHYEETAHGSL